MGSINSVPIISQIKSIAQLVRGDVDGARQTQLEFIDKGIIASQINSMVQAIKGNETEARRIQFAFTEDMESFANNAPVVGHIKAGVHEALGEHEKAEEIAIASTKSTVVALAGLAGAVCGPGAPACGGALAAGALGAWDATDSAIAGEDRGVVKGINDMVSGKANFDDNFDTIAGIGLTAAGGALASKSLTVKASSKAMVANSICRRRRSIYHSDNSLMFNENLPQLNSEVVHALPPSMESFNLANSTELMTPDNLVLTIYSIFMILKLMTLEHPSSEPYYKEICSKIYPEQLLSSCEMNLYSAIVKFGSFRKADVDDWNPIESLESKSVEVLFNDIFEGLLFQMKNLMRRNNLGQNLEIAICAQYSNQTERDECLSGLRFALKKLKVTFTVLDDVKIRQKRCEPKFFSTSPKFFSKHLMPEESFITIMKKSSNGKVSLGKNPNWYEVRSVVNKYPNSNVVSIIKKSDFENWNLNNAIHDPLNPGYYTFENVDMLKYTRSKNQVEVGSTGWVRVKVEPTETGVKVFHLENSGFDSMRDTIVINKNLDVNAG